MREEGRIWFAAGRGPAAGAKRRWGGPSCCLGKGIHAEHLFSRLVDQWNIRPTSGTALPRLGSCEPRSEGPKVLPVGLRTSDWSGRVSAYVVGRADLGSERGEDVRP